MPEQTSSWLRAARRARRRALQGAHGRVLSGNFLGYHNFALGGVLTSSGIVRADPASQRLVPPAAAAISVALAGPACQHRHLARGRGVRRRTSAQRLRQPRAALRCRRRMRRAESRAARCRVEAGCLAGRRGGRDDVRVDDGRSAECLANGDEKSAGGYARGRRARPDAGAGARSSRLRRRRRPARRGFLRKGRFTNAADLARKRREAATVGVSTLVSEGRPAHGRPASRW